MDILPLKSNGIRGKEWGFMQWTQLLSHPCILVSNKQFENMSHLDNEKVRLKYLYVSGMLLLDEEINQNDMQFWNDFSRFFTVSVNRFLQKLFTLKWPYTSSTE